MDKEKILDYVMNTPANTNRAVLEGMLDSEDIPTGDDGVLIDLIERDITSITIPNGTTKIGSYAFYNCGSLTSVAIPSGVTSIEDYAFNGCTNLTSVDIPSGVTSIGSYVFNGCTNLTSITVRATTPPAIENSTFTSVPSNAIIYVPSASVSTYKNASKWSSRASYIQAIPV